MLSIDVPEAYGGAELGLLTSALVASSFSDGSFSTAFGAHTTIGTLPIVFYGTEEQKQKYLPKLASGEWIAAYALTEPGVGSDAMGLSARAELSEDGKYYILNGTKQWISNAGFADMMIVFARIGNERPSAFIVEASWPGVSTGAEERKMGIKGSSTRQVYFENTKVPVENLLGEIHKGYKIAFNILNIGRLKLGAGAVGGARSCAGTGGSLYDRAQSLRQVHQRVRHDPEKLARIAADTYAAESEVFRTAANIENARRSAGNNTEAAFKAIEEYAVEASIAKVHGSEVLAFAVDEGVQIFGGYGFMQEYPIEKAYRDARIQRIYEGTNEINRLVASGTLFRRVLSGKLPLMTKFPEIEARVKANQPLNNAGEEYSRRAARCRQRPRTRQRRHRLHRDEGCHEVHAGARAGGRVHRIPGQPADRPVRRRQRAGSRDPGHAPGRRQRCHARPAGAARHLALLLAHPHQPRPGHYDQHRRRPRRKRTGTRPRLRRRLPGQRRNLAARRSPPSS